jgi:hypothetical protein
MMIESGKEKLSAVERSVQQRSVSGDQLDDLFRRQFDVSDPGVVCEFLEWLTTQRTTAIFNLWLARLQSPKVRWIGTERDWREAGRQLRTNAEPILILRAMGPVMVVYDISDTDGAQKPQAVPVERITIDPDRILKSVRQLAELGIETKTNYAGVANAIATGQAKRKEKLHYTIDAGGSDAPRFLFDKITRGACSIFCGHKGRFFKALDPWPDRDRLSPAVEKFETEAAAFLVLARAGIRAPDALHLAPMVESCNMASVSMDAIVRAAGKVEQLWR